MRIKILFLFIIVAGGGYVMGQQSNMLYFMDGVPQSYLVNPATQPSCDLFIGIPAVSPVQVFVESSSFSVSDVMWQDGDSTRLFFNTVEFQQDFLKNLAKSNFISTDVSTNIISFGFKSGDLYITYDLTERFSFRFSYPGDLFKFVFEGNERGDEFDMSNIGVEAVGFLEFATGVSHKINDQITLGYRGKILFGHANISTRKMDLKLITDLDWTVRSKFDLNATLPAIDIPTDSAGDFQFGDIDTQENLNASDYFKMATGNKGLAVDLGIHYRPIDKLTLAASLLDVGFIRWRNNTYNITQDVEYIYEGMDLDVANIDSTVFENFADSLKNTFVFNNKQQPYTSFLGAKLYVGGKYQIIEEISVGLLSRTEIFKGRIREQLTLSANFYPFKEIAASINYSIMNNTFNNFGFGISFKPGPFNLYFISDNVPLTFAVEESSGVPIPYKSRTLNFRFGFNLVFGCDKEKTKMKDQPLIRSIL
ncbi:MAG: hypothetical protein JSV22_14585 [Bacteroidales bacterium]|nr:MAG: hypothetical protein JSV22_14585 [Bacteroidales bacterium]